MIPIKEYIYDFDRIRPFIVKEVDAYFDRLASLTRLERKQGSIPDRMAIDMIFDDVVVTYRHLMTTREMVEKVFLERRGKK